MSGHSLNDLLLPGPSLYPLLTTVLLKFRRHEIEMSSDISQMFREVGLHPSDRYLHRYLVYNGTSERLQDWRMTRVTFEDASSPFKATQVLRTLADNYKDEHPRAASIIKDTFYVDDSLTGLGCHFLERGPQRLAVKRMHEAEEMVDEFFRTPVHHPQRDTRDRGDTDDYCS